MHMVGGGIWSEEDRAMASAVLGPQAFNYLTKSHLSSDGLITAVDGDSNFQNKLVDIVEAPGGAGWSFAIFWQISRSKSGEVFLGWGDGHLREPHMKLRRRPDPAQIRRQDPAAQAAGALRPLSKLQSRLLPKIQSPAAQIPPAQIRPRPSSRPCADPASPAPIRPPAISASCSAAISASCSAGRRIIFFY